MNENDNKRREAAMVDFAHRGKKKRRKMKKQFYFVLALLLVGVIAALSLTVLFPIKQIVISGESKYTNDQIITAMSVEVGDNIILADTDKAAGQIVARLPYIGAAEISKKLSGEMNVTVTAAPAVYAYELGGEFFLVNDIGKTVDTASEEPEDLCVMVGMPGASAEVGKDYVIADSERRNLADELIKSLGENKVKVTRIDLTDTINIIFVLENRIMVKLGSAENLTYKVAHAVTTFTSMSKTDEGTLDLTWWTSTKKDAYFRNGEIEELIYGDDAVSEPPVTSEKETTTTSGDEEDETSTSGDEEETSEII